MFKKSFFKQINQCLKKFILFGRGLDSGASVSVFPGPKSTSVDGVCLLTALRSRIIPLCFSWGSGSKVYLWNFQLAPVSVPLLGADFLQHFNLLFDIKGQWVVHADCPESVILRASPGPQPAFRSVAFLSLLNLSRNFWRIFRTFSLLTVSWPQNLVTG